MSLTVTLTNRMTKKPVAHRAIEIQFMEPSDDLDVITDENGQFTIDEKYRNIEFSLQPKYIEFGENTSNLYVGGWQNWESDTLNIRIMLSSGVEPRSLGAGITVAFKILGLCLVPGHYLKNPNPIELEIRLRSPDPLSPDSELLEVTTDHNGMFLIDEKYRNLECYILKPSYLRIGLVKLDNDYIEMVLDYNNISRYWLRPL